MENYTFGKLNKVRNRVLDKHGMTMAEMLITVSIIIILAAVAFISIIQYQRSLAQLERDKVAKEIFFAAQNHLTVAKGEGYLEANKYGIADTSNSGVFYYVYPEAQGEISFTEDNSSILDLMLPFGSLDETVRTGGSYIISYRKKTGRVIDVFYCSPDGTRFGNDIKSSEYSTLVSSYKGDDKKGDRRDNYNSGDSVIGWYGGNGKNYGDPLPLIAPEIEVKNKETLSVEVTDNNTTDKEYTVKLIITGVSSGAQKSFVLKPSGNESSDNSGRVSGEGPYTVLLDDITTSGMHFANIKGEKKQTIEDGTEAIIDFIPGENIKIQAVTYSLDEYATIEYSAESITNSLFEDASAGENSRTTTEIIDTVFIRNMRHLENLDKSVSNLTSDAAKKINILYAQQTANLIWKDNDQSTEDFVSATNSRPIYKYVETTALNGQQDPATKAGQYLPVDLTSFSYNGKQYSIYGVVAESENCGLFGELTTSTVKNVELLDFKITGSSTAGALAGTVNGTSTVINVIARNKDDNNVTNNIISARTAGGLIGSMAGGTVGYSAANMIVGNDSTSIAGGLIGESSANVSFCYSAGHTKDGSYEEWIDETGHTYDILGNIAGGLIGSSTGSISSSYSTCSVSGTGNAGGLVGTAEVKNDVTISHCYAAGQVYTDSITKNDNNKNDSRGAFAGSISGLSSTTINDCHYFSIINEVKLEETKGNKSFYTLDHYLGAVGDDNKNSIVDLDKNAETYEAFIPNSWKYAKPYDDKLEEYYGNSYHLRTVVQLVSETTLPEGYESWNDLFINVHYGDWPAPEVFIINN